MKTYGWRILDEDEEYYCTYCEDDHLADFEHPLFAPTILGNPDMSEDDMFNLLFHELKIFPSCVCLEKFPEVIARYVAIQP